MKLATLRTPLGTRAARVEPSASGGIAVEIEAPDVGVLLADPAWRRRAADADGRVHDLTGVDLAPVVPLPRKIICVGLNYRSHILEMGRPLPEYPTLFAKFAEVLTGPNDPIELPPESTAVDWEAELGVIVGRNVRRVDTAEAAAAIAGFAVVNDVSMRDWQFRTREWSQGKNFEASTPLGPYLVTPDELAGGTSPRLELHCAVDDETVQSANTADLLFRPADLVSYLSHMITLRPGDVIATGTPGGVGHARDPKRYLTDGALLATRFEGLGEQRNRVHSPPSTT